MVLVVDYDFVCGLMFVGGLFVVKFSSYATYCFGSWIVGCSMLVVRFLFCLCRCPSLCVHCVLFVICYLLFGA